MTTTTIMKSPAGKVARSTPVARPISTLDAAATRSPREHVGVATAVLATDYAKLITGETVYVDAGYDIVG